ncbi:MFS transporter [Actinokineospora enzanensis]|uniref:MFS transporter n=1 Tax=Actinokineospora enzanensis TaxID=155975 RepID=UPI00036FA03A|nr:MFS transporter [Actinokineospora enzanensis]
MRLQAVAVAGSCSEGLVFAALPLLAVSVTTDPRAVSLVNTVGQAPWLLLSLFAGVLIDRVRRGVVLAFAYAMQVAAALVLAIAGTTGALSLPLLMVVAFVVTSSQVLGDGASGSLVPEIVPEDRLAAANARLQVIERGVVQFLVPPAAGVLLAWGAGAPAWVACVGAAAALLISRRLPSTRFEGERKHPFRDIGEGLRYLVASPLLRSITITVVLGAFAASGTSAMFVLYVTQELHAGPVWYGILLACLAIGWFTASFFVNPLVTHLGYAWSLRISQTLAVTVPLLLALIPPWTALVAAILVCQSAGTLIWNVCSLSARQRFTPPALLGRVLTSHRALAWGLTPLGALTGGLIATHYPLRAVWIVAAGLQAVGLLIVWKTLSPTTFTQAETTHPPRT